MSVIEVSHLTKDYGSKRGVFDISFEVNKGECFGFLGPNGAGKSTTIRHILGFSKPQKGSIKVLGYPSFKKYYKFLNKVGYIPGEIAMPVGLTGYAFIKMMQDLQGVHNKKKLDYLLDLFDLKPNVLSSDTKRMSLGVKRKLAIVVAFMSDPKVLILDEPTSGLDPIMQNNFINLIKEEKKEGKTILLSSHIFSEVDATCDRIAIIKDGKIVSQFVANDLKHATKKFYEIYFKTKVGYGKFYDKYKKTPFLKILRNDENKKMVFVEIDDKNINTLINILNQYDLDYFTNIKETLEDYFMKFYKEDVSYKGAF